MTQIWEVRGVTLCKRSVKRLRIVRGIVADSEFGSENAARALADLIVLLHAAFRPLPISLEGLRPEPDHRIACSDERVLSLFLPLKRRPDQLHHALDLPKPPRGYLDQLSSKDRQNIRRHERRLQEHCDGDVRLATYEDEADVQTFLDVALPIARMSYQYRAYSAGLAAQAGVLEKYRGMARRGWWRGNVLYCKGEPVVFLSACEIDGTCFGDEIAYNPAWAVWGVGIHAMVSRIESLVNRPGPPDRFDFGPGDYEYKRRLVNCSWTECCYDLIPKNVRTMVPFVAVHAASRGTDAVRAAVRKLGLVSRKESVRRNGQSASPSKPDSSADPGSGQ